MLQTLIVLILLMPNQGNAEETMTPKRSLNFELTSTNACPGQLASTRIFVANESSHDFIHLSDWCRREITTPWGKDNLAVGEAATWLTLKSVKSHDLKTIGIGFRFQVAQYGEAQFRLRGRSGFQLRYKATF